MDKKAHCEIFQHCEESHQQFYEIDMPLLNDIVTIYIYKKHKKVEIHALYLPFRENPSVFTRVRFREIYFIRNIHFVPKNVSAL